MLLWHLRSWVQRAMQRVDWSSWKAIFFFPFICLLLFFFLQTPSPIVPAVAKWGIWAPWSDGKLTYWKEKLSSRYGTVNHLTLRPHPLRIWDKWRLRNLWLTMEAEWLLWAIALNYALCLWYQTAPSVIVSRPFHSYFFVEKSWLQKSDVQAFWSGMTWKPVKMEKFHSDHFNSYDCHFWLIGLTKQHPIPSINQKHFKNNSLIVIFCYDQHKANSSWTKIWWSIKKKYYQPQFSLSKLVFIA